MTGFTATVTGLDNIMQVFGNIPVKEKVGPFLQKVAEETAEYARLYAPQDTGLMEGSIEVRKVSNTHYQVRCDIPYAAMNEYGTIHMPASPNPYAPLPVVSTSGKHAFRPFMRPAVLRALRTVDIKLLMDSMFSEMK